MMNKKNTKHEVIVLGTGGLAREFKNYFEKQVSIIGYITTNPEEYQKYNLDGKLYSSEITIESSECKNLVIAIGSSRLKRMLHQKFKKKGFVFPTIKHSSSIVANSSIFGEGVIVSPFCVIGPQVNIGNCVYINYQVGIGHDSTIGPYTQINPGSQLGGNTIIKGDSLLGSNSTLLQNTFLEKNVTIGSGAVVTGKKLKAGTIAPFFSKYLPF